MKKSVALILAKSKSNRLPNKNVLPFHGKPMFVENLEKCLDIFDEVYVSTDSEEIAQITLDYSGKVIMRDGSLCGETPNIDVYNHALNFFNADYIVAVQANSPTVDKEKIVLVKRIMDFGVEEVKTCHEDKKDYGSIWAITTDKIKNYPDPYNAKPEVWVVDNCLDVHTLEDYNKVI